MNPQQLAQLNPLQLAYIGDGVYELLVRSDQVRTKGSVRALHQGSAGQVNACAQAEALERVQPHLSTEEMDMVRRGRNAHANHKAPKSASSAQYAAATAFEALFGWLYLSGREARMIELYRLSTGYNPYAAME